MRRKDTKKPDRVLPVGCSYCILKWSGTVGKRPTFSSTPYVVEFTKIFELPQWQDASFLHQKYVVEGFSSAQIADEIGCSKTSVKKGLRIFKIRKNGHGVHAANLALGQKIVKGKVVEHKGESQLLTAIMKMHQQQRLSTTAIAKILNDMKVPTKKQGKAWDHSTVRRILLRSGVCENNGRGS